MDVDTRDFVIHHLRQAQLAIELAQRGAPVQTDFGPTLETISETRTECGDTPEATRDPVKIGRLMNEEIRALTLINAGEAAASSVAMAIGHMQKIADRMQQAPA